MADINGIPYVEATDLVSAYPGVSLALATELDDQLGSKLDYPAGGSDGDLLAKDGTDAEWIAPPDAGLTFVTSDTFSAVSSVSVNNCFTTTHKFYRLMFRLVSNTGTPNISFRYRASGSDLTTAAYTTDQNFGASSNKTDNQTSHPTLFTISDEVQSQTLDIAFPAIAEFTNLTGLGFRSVSRTASFLGGVFRSATAVDGFTITVTTGTMSGQLNVYGYKE
jgi:hypothetical protein